MGPAPAAVSDALDVPFSTTHHVASAKDGGPRKAAAALRLACLLAVDEPALRDGTISQRAEEDRQSAART
jgi:hypothetical protein